MDSFCQKRDRLATKPSVLCESHFEEKYLRQEEKCALQWSMNPIPPFNLKNFQVNHLCYQHSKLLAVIPEKDPSQQRDIIRTFQDLNKSIAPAGFQF